ncbi:MAG: hypothetical protein IKQ31_01710 [Clostridia bacterium]|nr:hypothetical protein [Clostridia bacterium]
MRISARLTISLSCVIVLVTILLSGIFILGGEKSKIWADGEEQTTEVEKAQSNGMPLMHKITLYANGNFIRDIYVTDGGVLNEEELVDMVTFEPGGYLTDEDVAKIRDVKWYYYSTEASFNFSEPITAELIREHSETAGIKLDARYDTKVAEQDLTYIWVLVIGAAVIVLIFVIATLLRNHTTKMSLKNKYVMSPKLKNQVEEIKEIEKRKEQYSVLNDDD